MSRPSSDYNDQKVFLNQTIFIKHGSWNGLIIFNGMETNNTDKAVGKGMKPAWIRRTNEGRVVVTALNIAM